MSDTNHHYVFCPFGGIVCTICGYPVFATERTIQRNIYMHERKNRKHKELQLQLNHDERDQVTREFTTAMKLLATQFISSRNPGFFDGTYLNEPRLYPFCSECNSLVFDTTHLRKQHYKFCQHKDNGRTTTTWTAKQPRIFGQTIDTDDSTIFCSEFWQFVEQEKQRVCAAVVTKMSEIANQQQTIFQTNLNQQQIEDLDPKLQPSLFIIRSGWAKYLSGFQPSEIYRLASKISDADAVQVVQVVSRCKDVIQLCVQEAKNIERGHFVLFVVKGQFPFTEDSTKPFNANIEKGTWEKYISHFLRIISVIFRMECCDNFVKIPFQYSTDQIDLIRVIKDNSNESAIHYVKFMLSLFKQQIQDSAYECIAIGSLAAMSIKEDSTFLTPGETTQIYAGIIAVLRVLLLYLIKHNSPDENYDLSFAKEMTSTIISKDVYNPVAWIIKMFCYAKTIDSQTVADSNLRWDEDVLIYKKIRISMINMKSIIKQKLLLASEVLMKELLFCKKVSLPRIEWDLVYDDISNNANGYSFLDEPNNSAWLEHGKNFVIQQIGKNYNLSCSWYDTQTNIMIANRIITYEIALQKFRELVLCLMHITAGQPSRGPEMMGITYKNTPSNRRNLYIDRKILCVEVIYKKNMIQYQSTKQVFRFLPKNVSDLLVYYLWLVVPFYETTKGSLSNAICRHPYIWSHNIVTPNFDIDIISSNMLAQYLNSFFDGNGINIATWRHIAIAISRKYLRGGMFDDETDETHDAQAGHSKYTGERIYGRLKTDNTSTIQGQVDMFRKISLLWHDFLFDKQGDNTHANNNTISVKEIRAQRLVTLSQWTQNLESLLQMYTKDSQSTFRGNQKVTLEAIITRMPIVLQIAPTGVGKSLSFMLPAYADPYSCTIVIVPLISLEDDLLLRCRNENIRACIWRSGSIPTTPPQILLVTPEAASTDGFYEHAQSLKAKGALDRIVIDECHLLLSSTADFRPTMNNFTLLVHNLGVQLVLLTATLPIDQEDALFLLLGLERRHISILRSRTIRSNIRYEVLTTSFNQKKLISTLKDELLSLNDNEKCIIYVRSIDIGKFLSTELKCHFYYSGIGTNERKKEIVSSWRRNQSFIIATNALGCGLDIPNIRLVVHVGSPHCISDYVQESGRCGRDGRSSRALLLHLGKKYSVDSSMKDYISNSICRRFVINQNMDGDDIKISCLDGKHVACDLCSPPKNSAKRKRNDDVVVPIALDDENNGNDNINDDEFDRALAEYAVPERSTNHNPYASVHTPATYAQSTSSLQMNLLLSREERSIDQQQQVRANQEDEMTYCKDLLHLFQKSACKLCILEKKNTCDTSHSSLNKDIVDLRNQTIDNIKQNRTLEDYSGCYHCYIPQLFCNRCQGNKNDECIYKNIVLDVVLTAISKFPETLPDDVHQTDNLLKRSKYFGKKVRWKSLETNQMFILFYNICKKLNIKK